MLTQLELRKIRKIIIKSWRREKKNKFETYCLMWARIRKQKDRRRRRCMAKLYRIEQERKLRTGELKLTA